MFEYASNHMCQFEQQVLSVSLSVYRVKAVRISWLPFHSAVVLSGLMQLDLMA
jgi:hypothetical protein